MDLIIILFLITAVIRGMQTGLLRLVLSFAGFMGGLLLGSWLAKLVAPHFSGPTDRLVVILSIEFGLAIALWAAGEALGHRLKPHAVKLHLGRLNEAAGGVLEVLFTLFVIWLVASSLVNVRSLGLGHDIQRSLIMRKMATISPHPPDIFAQLEKIVSPNGFPDVFLGLEPQHTKVSPKNSVSNQAILAAENSVVRIQSIGCGGIVFGSGFVAADDLVVTNAHVVAGTSRTQVVDQNKSYQATPVLFDPNLDIAILRVKNLPDEPLRMSGAILPDADAVATLGFPRGGDLVVDNAVIIDHVTAAGRNIYNSGITYRQIYEVQAKVEQGDSGGPLLAPDGTVAGVVFAKSVSQDDVGYALLINQVQPLVDRAGHKTSKVNTGYCAQE